MSSIKMSAEARSKLRDIFAEKYCNPVLKAKGAEYSQGSDASGTDTNANFNLVAQMLGISPLEVVFVYFMKHVASIAAYVQSGEEGTEDILGRFGDARNYLDIMATAVMQLDADS